MSNWKRDGWSHSLISGVSGESRGMIDMLHDRNSRRDTIIAEVRTPLFPTISKSGFTTIVDAKAWCEQWIYFATELLELRKTVDILRETGKANFAEIMALRNELHDYRYPHAKSEAK